jgi:hypothetical protein
MTTLVLLGIAIVVIFAGILLVRSIPAVRAYFTFRGKRLISCPETHHPEVIDVAAREAALTALYGAPTLRLDRCSRWPERQDCGQECLQQVEADPENCLLWNIVSKWYEGQRCVYCRKPFERLQHLDHPPALIGPDQTTAEWTQFRPEQLPAIFSTFKPVCWNCHIAETFRREHPELVTDRQRESQLTTTSPPFPS